MIVGHLGGSITHGEDFLSFDRKTEKPQDFIRIEANSQRSSHLHLEHSKLFFEEVAIL